MTTDITQRLSEIKERWPVTDADEREATQDIRYLLAEIERRDREIAEKYAEIERLKAGSQWKTLRITHSASHGM